MCKSLVTYALLLLIPAALLATEPDTAFNNQFRREIGGWIAADATYSILLPDGRTLWLFGDTFIGEVDENNAIIPGSKFIRNSAVIQDGELLETLVGGSREDPSDFIPTLHPDSTWYWPEHGLVLDDTLRIFMARYTRDPQGAPGFQFRYAGNDIANFTYPGLDFIGAVPVEHPGSNGVIYGDRVLEDSGTIYIYGRRNDNPEVNIPYPHAARTTPEGFMKQDWEFYDGTGWSAEPGATSRINAFQVSQQYSVSTYRGKYILLTQDIWLSPRIWSFVSDSPVGPWESKKLVYTTPESSGGLFTYNAYAHPQFDRDASMLLSYNVNGDFWSIFSNVENYRPRFIRVPYMNLHYDFWPNGSGPSRAPTRLGIGLFPNPVGDHATLSVSTGISQEISPTLLDLNGRLVRSYPSFWVTPGSHPEVLDMEAIPPGIYLLRIQSTHGPHVVQVTKL